MTLRFVLGLAAALALSGCTLSSSLTDLGSQVDDSLVRIDTNTTPNFINDSNDSSFPLMGQCPAGATEIVVTSPVNLTIPCVNGQFSGNINLSTLPEGDNTFNLVPDVGTPKTWTVTKDTVLPTVTLDPLASFINLANVSSFPVSGTCSEDGRFVYIAAGALRLPLLCSSSVYSGTLNLSSLAEGAVTLTAELEDSAGNLATDSESTTKDTIAPSLALTSPAGSSFNTASFAVTATFSESVTGFVVGEITATNGSVSAFSGSGTTYTFTVTPSAEGLVTVAVGAGVAQDAAGNPNTAASNLLRTYDVTSPSLVLSSAVSNPFSSASFTVTATFSEAVTGFVLGDISVTNGTASSLSGSGTTYSFTVTPSAAGLVTVAVGAGVAQDAANNGNLAATDLQRTYDISQPTVTLSSATPDPFNSGSISVTATFSESVTGFGLSDILVSNGTASSFAGSGSSYTFSVTPTGQGLVTIGVPANAAQDSAGNLNVAATDLTRTFDSVQPSVTLTTAALDPFSSANISVTATFSESVTGFVIGDISVTNGSASAFAGSGSSYTFTVTPTSQGLVTVGIAAGVAQDAAGNLNIAATNLTRTWDTSAPTITGLSNDPTWTTSKTWTWGCSETCTYRFVVDTSAGTSPSGTYSATNTTSQASGSGTYYLHVQAQDSAGNLSSVVHVSALLDNTVPNAPTGLVDQIYSSSLTQSPVVTFTAGSDTHSGIQKYQARVIRVSDSTAMSSWADFVSGGTITGLSLATNTSYRVEVKAIDNVGLESSVAQSDGWLADNTSPTVPSGLGAGSVPSNLTSTPNLTWTASTDTGGSGVSYYEARVYRTSDDVAMSSWTTLASGSAISGLSLAANTSYYAVVRAYDNAGNVSASSSSVSWTSMNDPCLVSPTPGTVCASGTIFLGTLSPGAPTGSGTDKYMTTPGGCGDCPGGGLCSVSFTPTCSGGADSLTKNWNNGTTSWLNVPGITATPNSTWIDQNYGSSNTTALMAQTSPYHHAAHYCANMVFGGYDDWHLPAIQEAQLFATNNAVIPGLNATYWSSSEGGGACSELYDAILWGTGGPSGCDNKNSSRRVRCIRRFQ